MNEPTWGGVRAAEGVLAGHLPATPAWNYPLLDAAVGSTVMLKHENVQPTGAFKVRGGLNLVALLEPATSGLATASTGNHAQSVAYAARAKGMPVVVVMPITAPESKVRAVQALGAEVIQHGPSMTEAIAHANIVAVERSWRFVSPVDTEIIHGHATVSSEFLRAHPRLEALYVAVGSGTTAAGACLAREGLGLSVRIVGVQSAQAPAAHRAWRSGGPQTATCTTRASGLATSASFEATQRVLREHLDDFLLVQDDEIDAAVRLLAQNAHTLAEGAGAAALAGAIADPHRPSLCGVIVSGGNADPRELSILASD